MAQKIKDDLSWMDKSPSMSDCMKSTSACKKYFETNMKFSRMNMVSKYHVHGKVFTGMFGVTSEKKAQHLAEMFRKAGLHAGVVKQGREYSVIARRK